LTAKARIKETLDAPMSAHLAGAADASSGTSAAGNSS